MTFVQILHERRVTGVFVKQHANSTTQSMLSDDNEILNRKSQSNLGTAASPPLTQRMDSSAACPTSCAMPTADKSNHSGAGTILLMYDWTNLPYVNDHCTLNVYRRKQRHAKVSRRLAQSSPIGWLNRAKNTQLATQWRQPHCKVAGTRDFFVN